MNASVKAQHAPISLNHQRLRWLSHAYATCNALQAGIVPAEKERAIVACQGTPLY